MSASRRLLGTRNASFAPQLGIKGLVSELTFGDGTIWLQANQNDIYTLLHIWIIWLSRQVKSQKTVWQVKVTWIFGLLSFFQSPKELNCITDIRSVPGP